MTIERPAVVNEPPRNEAKPSPPCAAPGPWVAVRYSRWGWRIERRNPVPGVLWEFVGPMWTERGARRAIRREARREARR